MLDSLRQDKKMRKISPVYTEKMKSYYGKNPPAGIAKYDAIPIKSFRALVCEVAELSCLNRDWLLFYRGQTHDYRSKGNSSTLYPSIFRGESISKTELELRFSFLQTMAANLRTRIKEEYPKSERMKELVSRKRVQWSILQHYEVCPTPFLDVTQSLLVACSFAYCNSKDCAYLYVLGLPYNVNRISRNSEHDLINIRLLSICPPEALRPHFQEGYLVGTDGIDYQSVDKIKYDFNRRILAKYKLPDATSFWSDGFSALPSETLYPSNDPIASICEQINEEAKTSISNESIGSLISKWSELESLIFLLSKENSQHRSFAESIHMLYLNNVLTDESINMLNYVRQIRNAIVHDPASTRISDVLESSKLIESLLVIIESNLKK